LWGFGDFPRDGLIVTMPDFANFLILGILWTKSWSRDTFGGQNDGL